MEFAPLFAHGCSIKVDKSEFHERINRKGSVRAADFVTLLGERLYIIEAKTTFFSPKDYEEVKNKFQNSLHMLASREIGRHEDLTREFPKLKEKRLADCRIKIVLVIQKCSKEHRTAIKEKLFRELAGMRRIWDAEIIVLDPEMAMKGKTRFINGTVETQTGQQ